MENEVDFLKGKISSVQGAIYDQEISKAFPFPPLAGVGQTLKILLWFFFLHRSFSVLWPNLHERSLRGSGN
jgi:hypothetical protein